MKLILPAFLLTTFFSSQAQILDPVKWNFSSKKIGDKTFEVQLTATLNTNWHIYSQTQSSDASVQPTEVNFSANPLVTLDGKVKELGKMEIVHDRKLGFSVNQYSGKVVFVQKIKVKSNTKTTVVGTIEYMTCDNSRCLPPKKIPFTITLK